MPRYEVSRLIQSRVSLGDDVVIEGVRFHPVVPFRSGEVIVSETIEADAYRVASKLFDQHLLPVVEAVTVMTGAALVPLGASTLVSKERSKYIYLHAVRRREAAHLTVAPPFHDDLLARSAKAAAVLVRTPNLRDAAYFLRQAALTDSVVTATFHNTPSGLVSVGVLVMTSIFAVMLTWWITPVIQTSGQRFDFGTFDIHGIVVFGYAIFALALGFFAGAVTGRLLPAMATTIVGFLATRLVVMLAARPNYLPTETERVDLPQGVGGVQWNLLHGDWIRGRHLELADGCNEHLSQVPGHCVEILTIHPARHFWTFQAIETAIFVALALCLVLATIYWIRRRIA